MPAEAERDTLAGVEPRPGVAKPDPILEVRDLAKSFDALVAVDVHHLSVQRRAITALIGPNGAGKTTLFNLVTGFDHPDRGEWEFDHIRLGRLPAHRIAQHGLVRTFQLTKALAKMSVLDNMMLGASGQRGERLGSCLFKQIWNPQERDIEARARALLDRFGLAGVAGDYAGTLSGGQRKLLEMARALMAEPRMIMFDEPTAGVNPALKESILDHIRELRDAGMTVLFVEHDMDVVMGISDWVVCMDLGEAIAEGRPEEVGRNEAVIDAYLGARAEAPG